MTKRGRKLKIATPEEFEEKAMSVLKECEADDGPVPTILWLEHKMDISNFYEYLARPQFTDTVTRVKKKALALYEQKANKGVIVPKISAMRLAHESDYAPVVQQIDMNANTTINSKVFDNLFARAEALTTEGRKQLQKDLSSILGEEDEEDN